MSSRQVGMPSSHTMEEAHAIKLMLCRLPITKAVFVCTHFPCTFNITKCSPSYQKAVPPLGAWIPPFLPTQKLYSVSSLSFLTSLSLSLSLFVNNSICGCSNSSCLKQKLLLISYPPQCTAWSVSSSLKAWSPLATCSPFSPHPIPSGFRLHNSRQRS